MNKRLLWLGLALSLVQQLSAESFTTNVIDGVSTNITEDFLLGATGPHNFLLITNGGAMTNHGQVFIGRTAEAHNNVAIVRGVGSTWHVDYLCYLGQASASNVFAILDGAHVHIPGALDMGLHYAASNNFLHVSGVGSTLTAGGLYVESGPGNQLLIEDSAAVQFGSIIVNGFPPWSGYQAITVRGVGSRLILTNLLHVDRTPANTISILDGAYFESGWSFFGTENSVGNQIIVSGPGTEWWSVGELSIATTFSSSNRIVLEDGAKSQGSRIFLGRAGWGNSYSITSGGGLSASEVNVGEDWGAFYNQLLVTDPGSTLTNFSTLIVGQRGSENSLVLSNGAFAQSGDFVLGVQHTSSNNQAIVTGTNTLWIGNRLTVGSAGHLNTMSVDQGANVFADSFLSGGQGGSGNLTVVSGRGSRLGVTNQLDLGFNFYSGNSLVITNDARVESGSGVVGSQGYRHNAIISGASWSNVTSIIIGSQSFDNVLRLSANGRLYSSNAVVGAGDNADRNRVVLSGKGTWWRMLNDLNVGEWGDSNEVAVSNGAAISANSLNVGGYFVPNPATNFPSDVNRLVVHGTNTVVNVVGNLSLGYNGRSNHLELRARAQLTSGSAEVATRSGAAGNTILVSDPGTRWHNTNALVLGSNGYGSTLIISNGAILRTGPVIVGDSGVRLRVSAGCSNQFGFNQVIVAGTGTVWQVDGTLGLGRNSASNSVVLKEGATLRGADISIGEYGGTCTAEIGSSLIMESGTLAVPRVFTAPRGRFRMLSGRADIGALQSEGGPPGRQQILGGTVRAGSIYASAPAQVEIGDGTRRAVLELTGGNYFSSGRIIIASNSVLAGRGSINGGFTNAGTYGTLRSITAITNASLQGSSGFDVWISALGPATGHSLLNVAQPFPLPTPMVLGGRLRVAINPSFQPHPTNEFPVVMFNLVTGSFSNAPHESRLKAVDNLASFLVLYRSNAVVLTDYRSTDLDGDGIEDQWATNHFGHTPLTSAERAADNDGDGVSNYDEFRAGTDPSDPASALRVSVTMTQGAARLQWPCVDGKTYRVYFSGDMRNWREVSDATFAFPQAGLCEWRDDADAASGQMRFYRVAVE